MDLELVKNILIKDFKIFADRRVYNDEENDPLSAHLFAIDGKIFICFMSILMSFCLTIEIINESNLCFKVTNGKNYANHFRQHSRQEELN